MKFSEPGLFKHIFLTVTMLIFWFRTSRSTEEKLYFPMNCPKHIVVVQVKRTLTVENGTKPGLSTTAPDKLHRDLHSVSVSSFQLLIVRFHKPTDTLKVSSRLERSSYDLHSGRLLR